MPEETVDIPEEGETVELKETEATEGARQHADEFEVQKTRFRYRPSATGGYATTFTTTVTPKGEDRPRLEVPTETIITV